MNMNEKKKLIILGAGRFAEEALDLVQETGLFEVVCFVEGIDPTQCGKKIGGIPVVWVDEVAGFDSSHVFLCTVGSPKRRSLIARVNHNGMEFVNLIHPSAQISGRARMGKDDIIGIGVVIASGTTIADHVLINRGCLIGHHVEVAPYVTISPGVNIGGSVRIGEGTYVGMGAIILDHITIGSNSVIGAGAVVAEDVPDNVQVLGVPARITKTFPRIP